MLRTGKLIFSYPAECRMSTTQLPWKATKSHLSEYKNPHCCSKSLMRFTQTSEKLWGIIFWHQKPLPFVLSSPHLSCTRSFPWLSWPWLKQKKKWSPKFCKSLQNFGPLFEIFICCSIQKLHAKPWAQKMHIFVLFQKRYCLCYFEYVTCAKKMFFCTHPFLMK